MLPPVSRKYIDFMTHRFIKGLIMLPIKEFEGRNAVSFRIPYVETHNQHKSLNYEDYLFDKIVNV